MNKKALASLCILSGEIGRHINFGRELVFSADLCYNGTNKKPRQIVKPSATLFSKIHLETKNQGIYEDDC